MQKITLNNAQLKQIFEVAQSSISKDAEFLLEAFLATSNKRRTRLMQKFTIKGRLPSRNEAERAARTHWAVGAKLKKDATEAVWREA